MTSISARKLDDSIRIVRTKATMDWLYYEDVNGFHGRDIYKWLLKNGDNADELFSGYMSLYLKPHNKPCAEILYKKMKEFGANEVNFYVIENQTWIRAWWD